MSDAQVYTERDHFDITVHIPGLNLLLVIENKIGASESVEQLRTYRERAEARYEHRFFGVFLTVDGVAGEDPAWASLSYQTVVAVLKRVRQTAGTLPPAITVALDHYVELIERHIVVSEALKEACRKIYALHRTAIDLLIEHGQVSILFSAFDVFLLETPSAFRCRGNNASRVNFSIKRWDEDLTFQVADLTRWGNRSPLQFGFFLTDSELSLFFEVGPVVGDTFDRNALIVALRKLFAKKDGKITNVYTRIERHKVKVNDSMSTIEIAENMRQLWKVFGAEEKLESIETLMKQVASGKPVELAG